MQIKMQKENDHLCYMDEKSTAEAFAC